MNKVFLSIYLSTYHTYRVHPKKVVELLSALTRSLLIIQGVSKKGNRTLQCSSAFIIQSTEIILSQAERPGF